MPELERMVRIRQCSGGVYPRLLLSSSSVIARHDSAGAIPGGYHAEFTLSGGEILRPDKSGLRMTKGKGLVMTRSEGLAMTGRFWE